MKVYSRRTGTRVSSVWRERSFLIQYATPKGILKMALAIALSFASPEVYAVVNTSFPTAHSRNGVLYAPASGNRNNGSGGLNNVGSNGNYWSFAPNSQTNARNLNFNSGNVNPLNNNNRANGFSVRPARALGKARVLFPNTPMQYKLNDIHSLVTSAYLKAREEERGTYAQIEFELQLEKNIKDIALELYHRTWYPQPLDWFVITEPTVREVFAPKFRDRVVSHVLFMLISPIFERYFVYDSFSCRSGKGTLCGIERLEHHIRAVTDNYRYEAWSLNYDVKAYFMSINRAKLLEIIYETLEKHRIKEPERIDYDFAEWINAVFLTRDPLEGCVYHGNPELIRLIQPGKSLRDQEPGVGIPIGDVINQLCSNIYLNVLDQYIKRILLIKHAVRYVDDGKMLHRDRAYLEYCWAMADEFLQRELMLQLHPLKTTITNLSEPTYFLGAVLKPYRRHARNDTVRRFKDFVAAADLSLSLGRKTPIELLPNLNSRLGYLSHFNEWRMTDKTIESSNLRHYFNFKPDYTKATIKKPTNYALLIP